MSYDSDGDSSDWIELYNPTIVDINLGGMYLTDNPQNLMKYRIPDGTVIGASGPDPADGYLVFYQDQHFGNPHNPDCIVPFALSEGGDSVYLFSGDGSVLTGYLDQKTFGASETDVSFGRYRKARLWWVEDVS